MRAWTFWMATCCCLMLMLVVIVSSRSLSWTLGPSRNPH
jgi:hypothetical protein